MTNTQQHQHHSAWSPVLQQFASDLGATDYESGSLAFSTPEGAEVVVEPLAGDNALTVHTSLGRAPARSDDLFAAGPFESLLAANAALRNRDAPSHAFDPVTEEVVLFSRFEDPAGMGYEFFSDRVREIALAAGQGASVDTQAEAARADEAAARASAAHDNAFRNVWSDLLFARGLATAGDNDVDAMGGLIVLDDGGWLVVHNESAAGTVLIEAVLGFMPVDGGDDEPRYRQLLEANLLGESTGGATFALDPDDQCVVACRRLQLPGLDAATLGRELDQLGMTAARFAEQFGMERPG